MRGPFAQGLIPPARSRSLRLRDRTPPAVVGIDLSQSRSAAAQAIISARRARACRSDGRRYAQVRCPRRVYGQTLPRPASVTPFNPLGHLPGLKLSVSTKASRLTNPSASPVDLARVGTEAHSFKTSRHETAEEQERHLLPSCKLGAVQAAPQAGDPSWTSTMAAQTCSSPPPPRQRRESGRLPHRTETSLRPVAITASSSTTRTEYPKRSHHRPACTSARIMAETSAWKAGKTPAMIPPIVGEQRSPSRGQFP